MTENMPNNSSISEIILLQDALEELENFLCGDEWKYSHKTIKGYVFGLKKFFFFVEKTKQKTAVAQLVKQDVVDYLHTLYQRELKKTTIRTQFTILQRSFLFLKMIGIMTFNPIENYKLERIGGRSRTKASDQVKALPKDQMRQFLDGIRNYKKQYSKYYLAMHKKELDARPKIKTSKNEWAPIEFRDYLAVILMYQTGLRKDELVSLRINQVDLAAHTLRQVLGKGNVLQDIPIYDLPEKYLYPELPPNYESIFELLKVYIEGKLPTAPLFEGEDPTETLSEGALNKRFDVWSQRLAQLPHLNPHMMRHTFGTHLGEYTGNPIFVKAAMRHEDLGTTSRYVHPPTQNVVDFFTQQGLYTGNAALDPLHLEKTQKQ